MISESAVDCLHMVLEQSAKEVPEGRMKVARQFTGGYGRSDFAVSRRDT
jgi:hypothetical protein